MPHVNFHDLRHSCASILLALGANLHAIGKILGHANVQTTQRYTTCGSRRNGQRSTDSQIWL
ncbi:tyrosine-type recombinase/integrase [Massilia sp. NR 4-1]|uniref:tyrosine-type recombinase/integrase n=1 Tax=Massilia sp. NR 4-1 TaxID=1678028 RepID=UPI001E329B18|nr:tyrosine-type recombinase/integrase [Massilia sp. NR 4-1]